MPKPTDPSIGEAVEREGVSALPVGGGGRGSSGGRVPASPDGLTEGLHSTGWEATPGRVQRDPSAFMHALAAHEGFWCADFKLKYLDVHIDTRDPGRFTLSDRDKHPVSGEQIGAAMAQWRAWYPDLVESRSHSAGQPSEASTSALATDEPISSPPPTVGVEELIEALRPFAEVADVDIGSTEADDDTFRNAARAYAQAPPITVGDLRKAQAILHRLQGGEG